MRVDRRKLFVLEYVKDWTGSKAAIRAGYKAKNAKITASRLLEDSVVQEELQRIISERAMEAAEVLDRLGQIARASIGDLMRVVEVDKDGNPLDHPYLEFDLESAHRNELLYLVKSITPTRYGIKVEMHDQLRALELIGRHLAMFTDNVNLAQFGVKAYINVSPEDWNDSGPK